MKIIKNGFYFFLFDSYTFHLSIFFCLTAQIRTFKYYVEQSGYTTHSCLVLDFKGIVLTFHHRVLNFSLVFPCLLELA